MAEKRYPTWKYRYFRIRFFERYPYQFGLGLVWFHRDGQIVLTLGRWDITWGRP